MTKRFDKILLAVAIILIATCAVFAFVFSFDSVSETAYAATQHAEFFGNDNHGDNHAGTRLTDSFLNSHIDEEGNYSLPSGNYYLGSDLTLNKKLYFAGSVNFCLNGYKLTTEAGPVITVDDGVSSATTEHKSHEYCRIFDCHPSNCNVAAHKQHKFQNPLDNKEMTVDGGLITGGKGGGISIYSGILYIYNGTIAGNKSYYGGGGVSVTSGEFRMYGTATVMYNTAGWYGAGVAMGNNTKFLMKGGTIRDNGVPMEDYSRGGGVYLAKGVRFEMSAGTIRNNSANEGGGVYFVNNADSNVSAHVLLSGTAQIYDNTDEDKGYPFNIRCEEDHGAIEVGGVFQEGVRIVMSSVLDINGWDRDAQKLQPHEVFTDELGLYTAELYAYAGGAIWRDAHNHGNLVYKPLSRKGMDEYNYKMPKDNYYLTEDILNFSSIEFAAGSRLCLNGYHIGIMSSRLGHLPIILNDNCVIFNCREYRFRNSASGEILTGLTVRGNVTMETVDNGYINISTTGTNKSNFVGVGVYVESGSFTMNNGKISSLSAQSTQGTGGAIYVENGDLFLNGGEISGNSAKEGGGIYVKKGNVTVGGSFKLANNTAKNRGGGIFVADGNVTLNGGEISGNSANDGGGIYVQKGSITASDPVNFTGNKASGRGGGIFVETSATIQGLNISGNTATGDGGGVFANGNLKLIDVNIGKNTSGGKGGGVNVQDKGGSEISGNSIIGENTASGNSDGLYSIGEMTIKGLALNEDKLNIGGGKVTLADNGLTISDSGGDNHIFVNQKGTLEISSIAALASLANGSAKITLENESCKISLASSLKADETPLGGKIKVGYSSKDVTGTLVSKQSADCDVNVSQYFEYAAYEGVTLCCALTNDLLETAKTHALTLDEGGVKFNAEDLTATYSLKCERCNEKINGITISPKSEEEVVQPSCTTKGTKRYDFELTTDAIKQSLGEDVTYYSVTESYSNSYEAPFGEPTEHKWEIAIWEGRPDAGLTPDKGYGIAMATCANEGHDETRDGCKKSLTIRYENLERHEDTVPYVYDAKPYELIISDDDGFREHIDGYTQKIEYAKDAQSNEWTDKWTDAPEIKKAGYYKLTISTDLDKEKPMLVILMKVTPKSLKFGLNTSESVYNGTEVKDIDLIFDGLANGETLQKGVDYNITFNGKAESLPKEAGSYTVGVEFMHTEIASNYYYSDILQQIFTVRKAKLERPTGKESQEFVYNGSKQAMEIDGFVADRMTSSVTDGATFEGGLFSAKDFKEGGYTLTISISDKKNYEWTEGGDPAFTLTIKKAELNFTVPQNDVYTGAGKDLLGTIRGAGEDVLQKNTDYSVKYDGKDELPVAAKTYAVTVELKAESALAKNYTCSESQNYIVANAKLTENASFAPYKSGKQQIYEPSKSTSLDFPSYGAEGFPFATVGGQKASVKYILKTYGLDGGHADTEKIIAYLNKLKAGECDNEWKDSAGSAQAPESYCVYFKIEAQYHETYFGYYILNVYSALYTITLSDKDLGLGAKSYGDEAISAEDIKSALQSKTESIFASAGDMHGADLKDDLFADSKFTVYLMKDGARYLKNTFEIGAYSVHASYITAEGDENKYITFEWKLSGAEGDGRPAFEVGKRELTFEIDGSDKRPYASAAFDVDVTFAGLQNDEHLSKDRDYAVKFDGTDDLPIAAKTYKVTVELLDSDLAVNYKIKENASKDFEVQKADINLAVPQGTIYNGREVALFATINGEGDDVLIRGVDYFVKYDGQDILPQDAGTYEVEIQFAPASALAKNYNIPATQQFDIGRAQLEKPSAESENVTLEYNGGDRSINVGGFVADLMRAEVTGGVFNALSGLFSAKNVKDGGYKLTISLSNAKNYEWKDGNSDSVSFTLNITPATLEFETPQNDMYTGNAFDLFATLPGKGNDILVRGRDYAVKYDGKSDLPLAANTYEVTVELTRSELANNYVCGGAKNYTVAKAELQRPTASGRATLTYNGAEQSLKISDFVAEHMAAMTSAGASFEGGLFSAMNVGEHSLSISITDTVNFKWKDGKEEDSEFKLNITAAALDFDVPQGDVFNGREFLLLPTLRGENNDVLIRGKDYQVKFDGTDDLPVAAKTYEVTVELTRSELAKNYTCDGAKNYTVAKAKLQRPSAPQSSQSFVYNGEIQSMQIEGFVAEFMSATITDGASFGTFSGRFGAKNFRDGGYELKLAIADKNNYEWTDGSNDDVSFAIAISKAALDFELTAGESYDPNGYDILNAINGQSRDVLVNRVDFKLKFNGLDADPTKVGVYRVKAELLNTELANNYEMTTQEKTYSITKKSLEKPTVESVDLTYNGKIQFARISGFDYATMTADIEDFLGDRINGENAGTYSVVISIADVDDYQWADGSEDPITLTIEIARAALTFEATGEGVYDGEEKAANIIFGGLSGDDFLIAGEDYVVRYNGGDALPVGAGSYSVSVQLLDTVYANNYVMTTASQTYNVAKAKLAKLNSQQFSSEMHGKNKTFDIAGYDDEKYVLSGGDVKEGKLSVKKEGSYNVTVAIKDKANYTWEDGTNDDLIITMTVVDPRPIGFEETVAMAVAIPASTVTLAGVALAVALKLRKKRKLPKPSEEDPA